MGRVKTVLGIQWRAYWRRFVRPGTLTAGSNGILILIAFLFVFKYVGVLNTAGKELSIGKTRMFERLLLGLFIAWLFPLLSHTQLSISARSLRHLPLSLRELFTIKAVSLFIPPTTWMIVAASVALVYPVSKAPNTFAGIAVVLFLIVTSLFVGVTFAQLLSISFWRKRILFGVLPIIVASIVVVQQGLHLTLANSLSENTGKLITNPAFGLHLLLSFSVLTMFLLGVVLLALWSFQLSLRSENSYSSSKGTSFLLLGGKTGPLAMKDFRYYRRLLDPYLGIMTSIAGCFYLVVAPQPAEEVFWIFILFVFFPNSSLAFNYFGLDSRSGLDRYALLPLSGKDVVFSKNLAFVMYVALQLIPLFLFGIVRLGSVPTLFGVIEATLLALAYLTWGNLIAISHRFRMEFFRFSSGGSPIDALFGLFFGTLPGAIAIRLFTWGNWWGTVVMLVLYLAMYWFSLLWSGRKYEHVKL